MMDTHVGLLILDISGEAYLEPDISSTHMAFLGGWKRTIDFGPGLSHATLGSVSRWDCGSGETGSGVSGETSPSSCAGIGAENFIPTLPSYRPGSWQGSGPFM